MMTNNEKQEQTTQEAPSETTQSTPEQMAQQEPDLTVQMKPQKPGSSNRVLTPLRVAQAGVIAALYVLLCLPFAQFGFGMIQFRLAEVLTVLPAISMGAIPGVFIGCLISNVLNPGNLGIIDIVFGSAASLVAAILTHILAKSYRQMLLDSRKPGFDRKSEGYIWKMRFLRFMILLPPVVLNAVVVGTYLPYLLVEGGPEAFHVIATIGSIFLSQAIIVYTLGLALLLALEKIKLPLERL